MKKTFTFLSMLLMAMLLFCHTLQAQSVGDLVLNTQITATPNQIIIAWPTPESNQSVVIFKRDKGTINYESKGTINAPDSTFTDTDVSEGAIYEYQAILQENNNMVSATVFQAGTAVDLNHSKGTLLLLTTPEVADELEEEIASLRWDLRGDGWRTRLLTTASDLSAEEVKSAIETVKDRESDLKALYILGNVSVPYSGDKAPDAHIPDHRGAWPADPYYGDFTGQYTDEIVDFAEADRPANHNVPGDGKFDQNTVEGEVVLEIGRVDLTDMGKFNDDHLPLLKQYLTKASDFKNKRFSVEERGLLVDNFGRLGGEAPAFSVFNGMNALFGPDRHEEKSDFLNTLKNESYLFTYGAGPGNYQRASGIVHTDDYVSDELQHVFGIFFGSYFGDWDSPNNLLRAPLASSGPTLATFWSGRPQWHFHNMGLGATVGEAAKMSMNNSPNTTNYSAGFMPKGLHMALMGDPSLRMQYLTPVPDVSIDSSLYEEEKVQVNWISPRGGQWDDFVVLRAPHPDAPFEVIATTENTSFIDENPHDGKNYYMVKTRALVQTNAGAYYNTGIGKVDSATLSVTSSRDLTKLPENTKLQVFPNPSKADFQLQLNHEVQGNYVLQVYNSTGQLISHKEGQLPGGKFEYVLETTNWEAGVYMLRLQLGETSLQHKLIKVH